ncbi:UDP-N-acetylmuramate dehydrogenase [Streptomyces sp. NPDC051993]|uniref:UDP-N-acetylmuramate dehydrogenase n=1 Tax=Streptomyces sp. NPDC051993 TaxID=3155286 RepID=UPI00342C779B
MHITREVPLAPMSTLGLGGPATLVVDLPDLGGFPDFVELARHYSGTPVCVGDGSNVLFSDAGCAAPVLRLRTTGVRFTREPHGRVLAEVQAGHPLSDLVAATIAEGLSGMEMLVGIPGTAGATPVQNVGAYGQEVSDTLVEVTAWDWALSRRVRMSAAACGLGHRTSTFKGSRRWTLLTLMFALRPALLSAPIAYRQVADQLGVPVGTRVPMTEAAQAVLTVRRGKGMVIEGAGPDGRSAGSVFLSPELTPAQARSLRTRRAPVNEFPDGSTRISASWLIKNAGFALGSRVVDGIRISSQQYTLVAEGDATADGFADAIGVVLRRTLDRTGVRLIPEIDFLGEWQTPAYDMP